jgi:hypothetical protein
MNRKNIFLKNERKLAGWVIRGLHSDFKWLERILLKWLRFAWRHHPGPTENGPKEVKAIPTGPFAVKRSQQAGDLLVWVPRQIDSYLIDDLTGRFGYSHVTVDIGEVDLPTGKPVMLEIIIGQPVERKFQDEYGQRAFARIPLSKTGIDINTFVNCVKSTLGEPYDDLEALTLGEIDDPAKQVCSGIPADCLPEKVLREIATARRLGLLPHTSVSVHSRLNAHKMRVFISPNGFAQYYGAPRGKELHTTDFLVEPHMLNNSVTSVLRKQAWKAVPILGISVALTAALLLIIKYSRPQNR